MPSPEIYRYAAFISYRHVDPDRAHAAWLQRALEGYRVPGPARRELSLPASTGRIFRDEDEVSASADLNAEIETALRESRYLVVVCSPRTPASMWVGREIERFREMGRGDRILSLLIEGEPREAFPAALREIRTNLTSHAGPTTVEEVEPLAADLRPSSFRSPRQTRRIAKLRVLSALLGCRFDDLRRRDQERRQRIVAGFGVTAAIIALILGLLAMVAIRQRSLANENAKGWRAALDDYERLGDVTRLQDLTAEADKLWPADAANVPAMTSWVERAETLASRVGAHEDHLLRLRASQEVIPYSREDRERDVLAHENERTWLKIRREERETKTKALEEAEPPSQALIDEVLASFTAPDSGPSTRPATRPSPARVTLAHVEAEIARLEAVIQERLTWRFATTADQFRHDTTTKLVADLKEFVKPQFGLLAVMRARLAFAATVESETLEKHAMEWAAAIESIADTKQCPSYSGLRIVPQNGLIPVGRNPATGLWEFAHLQTTALGTNPIPERRPDGTLFVTPSTGIILVLLPGGTFRMGAIRPSNDHKVSDPNVDPQASPTEGLLTDVPLDAFFMSKYEMTQGQWTRIMRSNPSQHWLSSIGGQKIDHRNPVERVTWPEADRCMKNLGFALPTEAQWEYAARGGTTTPRWIKPDVKSFASLENIADQACQAMDGRDDRSYERWNDGFGFHAPVGTYAPNPFGLHDVYGNVSEWCRDWWYAKYTIKPNRGDGLRDIPGGGLNRIIRGGNYLGLSSRARSAYRNFDKDDARNSAVGFRPSRALLPQPSQASSR